MKQVAIYALCEFPDLGTVRYVGQSSNPEKRLAVHVHAHSDHSQRQRWIDQVIDNGGAIGCIVVEWVQPELADIAERYWIGSLNRSGYRLTNDAYLRHPLPDYTPSGSFNPLISTVLRTIPDRDEAEWHEDEYLKLGRALKRAGVDMRETMSEMFYRGICATFGGEITQSDIAELAEKGRQFLARRNEQTWAR